MARLITVAFLDAAWSTRQLYLAVGVVVLISAAAVCMIRSTVPARDTASSEELVEVKGDQVVSIPRLWRFEELVVEESAAVTALAAEMQLCVRLRQLGASSALIPGTCSDEDHLGHERYYWGGPGRVNEFFHC